MQTKYWSAAQSNEGFFPAFFGKEEAFLSAIVAVEFELSYQN
jgi:hypothetical protein